MTTIGGTNNLGTIFKYIPGTDTLIKVFDFDGINGSNPYGSLLYASTGTYYDNLTTIAGCDSVYKLTLTVNPTPNLFIISGQDTVTENQIEIYFTPNNSNVTYTWNVQSGNITNQICNDTTEIQWGTSGTGYIYVVAENQYGCKSDTASLEVTIGTTSVNELINNNNVTIYPNPVKDIITVKSNVLFTMEIYDLTGKKILTSKTKHTNISSINTGMYIILIKDKYNRLIKFDKLVKN